MVVVARRRFGEEINKCQFMGDVEGLHPEGYGALAFAHKKSYGVGILQKADSEACVGRDHNRNVVELEVLRDASIVVDIHDDLSEIGEYGKTFRMKFATDGCE